MTPLQNISKLTIAGSKPSSQLNTYTKKNIILRIILIKMKLEVFKL